MNKLIKRIYRIKGVASCSSWTVALKTEILSYLIFDVAKRAKYIQKVKLSFLKNQYKDLIAKYAKEDSYSSHTITDGKPKVWVMWWQGYDQMPSIVKSCIKSIKEHNKTGWDVVLITKYNYKKYITIPQHILDKVNKGIITFTHFSDIIRMTLLADHGGLWMDSTIFLTRDVTNEMISCPFFSLKSEESPLYVSRCKWTGFLMGGVNIKLFPFMKDLFFRHWRMYNSFIDYYFIDYGIRLLYDSDVNVRLMIDRGSMNANHLYWLQNHLGDVYEESKFIKLSESNTFNKLTWKVPYPHNINGRITYFGMIIDQSITNE